MKSVSGPGFVQPSLAQRQEEGGNCSQQQGPKFVAATNINSALTALFWPWNSFFPSVLRWEERQTHSVLVENVSFFAGDGFLRNRTMCYSGDFLNSNNRMMPSSSLSMRSGTEVRKPQDKHNMKLFQLAWTCLCPILFPRLTLYSVTQPLKFSFLSVFWSSLGQLVPANETMQCVIFKESLILYLFASVWHDDIQSQQ